MKIVLLDRYKIIINNIIAQYPYEFYLYGSYVKGTAKKFSDIDICVKGPISLSELSILDQAFEDSCLPMKVDLRSWDTMSDDFKKLIQNDLYLIKKS